METGAAYKDQQGQSLVEFAIIVPLLLLILLGIFEVGWALRGYLTLVNANREATRFASRGIYLDFDQKEDASLVGYTKIITHTVDSLSNQLAGMNFISNDPNANASMVVTYYNIEPRVFGCPGDPECIAFDCNQFTNPGYTAPTSINNVEYPLLVAPYPFDSGYELPAYYNSRHPSDTLDGLLDFMEAITAYHYHSGGPYFSKINPVEKVDELVRESNKINCQLKKKGLPANNMRVIIIEDSFYQEQLAGLPFITAFVPNPIPMYAHTTMRINPSAREQKEDDEDTACELYPIAIPSSAVSGKQYGTDLSIPVSNFHNIAGNFSYVQWDSSSATTPARLEQNMLNPGNVSLSFIEPNSNPVDQQISLGDWVASYPGIHASTIENELDGLATSSTEMLMMVWDDSDCLTGGSCLNATGSGSNAKVRLFSYVRMILQGAHLSSGTCTGGRSAPCLDFKFLAFEPNSCPETQ